MREIKFRAWGKIEKKMFYPAFLCEDGITLGKNGWANNILRDEYDLMQFTGLLDKNGKEIYEGDIVLYTPKYANKITYEVVFYEGAFVQTKRDDVRYYPDIWNDWDETEVIVNIYEEKKKDG